MKHIKLFEEYSADELTKNDDKYYKEYLTLKKDDISKMRDEYKQLRWEALRNLNADLEKDGHTGKLMSIDVSDDSLHKNLTGEKKEKFIKFSRILDFADGYKPKGDK